MTSREKLTHDGSCLLMSDMSSAHSVEEVDCTLEGNWASLWEEQMHVGKPMERMYYTWRQTIPLVLPQVCIHKTFIATFETPSSRRFQVLK